MKKKIGPGDMIYTFDSMSQTTDSYIVRSIGTENGHKKVYCFNPFGFVVVIDFKKAHLTKEGALEDKRDYLKQRISKLRDRIDWNEDRIVEVEYELNEIRRKSPKRGG